MKSEVVLTHEPHEFRILIVCEVSVATTNNLLADYQSALYVPIKSHAWDFAILPAFEITVWSHDEARNIKKGLPQRLVL